MNKNIKINDSNILGVIVQKVLTVLIIIFAIITLFVPSFIVGLEFCAGLTLFSIAYNNHKIYKKPKITILYIIFAILLILFGIMNLLGVL